MNVAYLSIGSNIDREHNLPACIELLAQHGRLLAVSAVFETAPVGNTTDPPFFNAAVALETALSPGQLKAQVLRPLEAQLGRRRSADPNAARTIDVDIALFNDQVIHQDGLHIPDPDILRHPHVALPLADLAPDYRHPETGQGLAEIARQVMVGVDHPPQRRDDVLRKPGS